MRLAGLAAFAVLLALVPLSHATEVVTVQGQNQLEYSLSGEADRDSTTPKEIFENWLDADIRFDRFLVGFRYEAFLPHELGTDSLRQGIVQRYAQAEYPSGGVRAGNFYEIFGRGLLFRSYEDRSIRIDGNMDGVLLWGEKGRFRAKAFGGRMREIETDERTAVLRGADLGADVGRGLGIGGSYLIQSAENPNAAGHVPPPGPRHVEVFGGRLSFIHDRFDVYYEGGRLNRLYLTSADRARGVTYDDLRGTGHYGALSLYPTAGLSVTAEYKEYERFRFRPVGSQGTDYNNPPAATRETGYTLISRHPHQLDANDERGFQVEAVAAPLGGTTITLSRAETDRLNGNPFFHEWYAEWRQEIGEKYSVAAVYDYIRDEETGTKNHTPVFEAGYHPGGEWSVRSEYQFQRSKVDLGTERNHLALLEFHATYDLVFSAVGEHAASIEPSVDPDGLPCSREKMDDFLYGQVDWFLSQQHHLSLMAGKRRAGFVCVGGVCRFEPEFEGFEFRLVSAF
ncbi:MAG: DUF6029 family protein [Candidatus Eisenbacteria bacterium]